MSIPSTSTRRPVAVAMLFLAVILLGIISFVRLPIDLLPDVSYPRLVVYTSYPDVAPAEVERLITERVEAQAAADCFTAGPLQTVILGEEPGHLAAGVLGERFAADAEEELEKIAEHAPGAQVYIRLIVEWSGTSVNPNTSHTLSEANNHSSVFR